MLELVTSPWADKFDFLIDSARTSLEISSPYISRGACRRVARLIEVAGVAETIKVNVLTDLSLRNMLEGTTDPLGLLELSSQIPNTEIRILPSLHAKIYVADNELAIITSSNLTENGILRNLEYGIRLDEPPIVEAVRSDFRRFFAIASVISQNQLASFAVVARELRDSSQRAQKSVRKSLQQEFARRLAAADAEILKARTAGRTAHAIFTEAILFLLQQSPMRTAMLHQHIQRIHPDLCDDSVDRVIDGQHFGKQWKHAVRSAQAHLRKAGRIELIEGVWQLLPDQAIE